MDYDTWLLKQADKHYEGDSCPNCGSDAHPYRGGCYDCAPDGDD